MLGYFLLGIAVLAGVYCLLRAFLTTAPRVLARVVRTAAITVGIGLILFLAVTGRLGLVLATVLPLAMLIWRWRNAGGPVPWRTRPTPGQTSEVRTRILHMRLDHDSGAMQGEILAGPYAGRSLVDLSLAELLDLLRLAETEDPQSARLLEGWLDRMQGSSWRSAREEQESGTGAGAQMGDDGPMTRAQAYSILGLEPGASPEAVKEAHRRLMQAVHPDHGGSGFLAAKINAARDLLLTP